MCRVVDIDRSFRRRARKKLHLEVEWRAVESLGNDRERRWKQQGAVVEGTVDRIDQLDCPRTGLFLSKEGDVGVGFDQPHRR
jgi:hypothetical protein